MKNHLIILLFFLGGATLINMPVKRTASFSRNSDYKFEFGRMTPEIKTEKLQRARYIDEIMPEFCRNFKLSYNESVQLDQLLKITESSQGYFFPPQAYARNCENYEDFMDYVAIEILTNYRGKVRSSKSTTNLLTTEQKEILTDPDLNTDIHIKIKFKYKGWAMEASDRDKIKEGEYTVTVVPQTEAIYPGGLQKLTSYLTEHIIDKISETEVSGKIKNAIVTFIINEQGQLVDVILSRSSTDPLMDQLILDAIHKMPPWEPAMDSKGLRVKQEFSIAFGGKRC